MNIDQLSWTSFFFRALTHDILLSRSLKRLKLPLWMFRALVLIAALPPLCRILSSTISWLLQPRRPPTFRFSVLLGLFYKVQQHTFLCWLFYHLGQKVTINDLQELLGCVLSHVVSLQKILGLLNYRSILPYTSDLLMSWSGLLRILLHFS